MHGVSIQGFGGCFDDDPIVYVDSESGPRSLDPLDKHPKLSSMITFRPKIRENLIKSLKMFRTIHEKNNLTNERQ